MSIKVTDNAFKRVDELIKLESNPSLVLRVVVDGGGCSGFVYKYALVPSNDITKDDCTIEKDNIKVVIDEISQQLMVDCIIDFIEELGSSYFEIRNPLAKNKCGCGNSFSV
ncbi:MULTISPECIES: HesB/IscA family protein [unclassified Candidatus Tisiphia]|jgi:iron-sulfur cluster assembly accessory protein|uniref:HesB/IscA family protein n=1 Tax=unclassified Candidatus Tisiphia TaxID=2996318 RepID=UPI001E6B2A1B|nr:MAG: iron-sulfur cluster assembly accessory protein [Rickettsia endosymbiont of Cimex lectularius]